LRGCTLKNTDWVIGLVVYTGPNTKIFKNSKSPPIKVSNVMRLMNKLLYSLFIFQLILCFLFSIFFIIWQNSNQNNLTYLEKYNQYVFQKEKLNANFGDWFLKFFTFLVAYSHLIPISLYVALEIVKMIQSILIFYDEKSVDPVSKNPAIARTSDLIEELGQVEFIFSDKTGTLTKNEMEFRKCLINNYIYGDVTQEGISSPVKNKENNDNSTFVTPFNYNYANAEKLSNKKLNYEDPKIKDIYNDGDIECSNINLNLRNNNSNVSEFLMNNICNLSADEKAFSVNGDSKASDILRGKIKEFNKNDKIFIEDFFTILSVCHSAYIDLKGEQKFFQVKYIKKLVF